MWIHVKNLVSAYVYLNAVWAADDRSPRLDRLGAAAQRLMSLGVLRNTSISQGLAKPFILLPRYWSSEQRVHEAAVQMQELMASCVIPGEGSSNEGNDNRTMGIQLMPGATLVSDFCNDPVFTEAAAAHFGTSMERMASERSCQAGSTTGTGTSSGGGWHQDQKFPGIKAMMYLSDVTEADCPFAMLLNYSNSRLKYTPPSEDPGGRRRRNRLQDTEIERHVAVGASVFPIISPRGSVIIFETSGVHRGMPCHSQGRRLTLTIYFRNPRMHETCKKQKHRHQLSRGNNAAAPKRN